MLYILIFIIGFLIGCIGMHSAISEELQQCKTSEELVQTVGKLNLIKSNKYGNKN